MDRAPGETVNSVPPMAWLAGALLLLVVGVMASKSSGPSYGQTPVNNNYAGQIQAYQAQAAAEADMATTGINAVLQYDAQKKGYDLGVLDIQTKAQTDRANLDAAERMYGKGLASQERQTLAAVDAQNRQAQAQAQAQQTDSIFGFLGNIAKIVLPFLF